MLIWKEELLRYIMFAISVLVKYLIHNSIEDRNCFYLVKAILIYHVYKCLIVALY